MRDSRLIDSESANLFSGYWIVNVGSGFRSECASIYDELLFFSGKQHYHKNRSNRQHATTKRILEVSISN